MPPKKKGKGKGGGGGGGGGKSKQLADPKDAMMTMFHNLDQDKINVLTRRVDETISEKMNLQRKLEKGEKDTHEFVNYFQHELEKKDALIAKQNEQLASAELTLKSTVANLKASYEAQLANMNEDRGKTEVGLRARLKVLEEELQKLDQFANDKRVMEDELKELKEELSRMEAAHVQSSTNQERKFLAEKARMQKEFEGQIQEMREEELERIQSGQDAETKKILQENKRIRDELRFQQEMTGELTAEKRRVQEVNKRLLREVELYAEKEREYAKQGKAKSGAIAELTEKCDALEAMLKDAGRKFGEEKQAVQRALKKDLEDQTLDAAGLRQLLRLKNRELQHVKTHARTILEQRTEVETFFLEALDQCKRNIVEERQQAYRASLADYRAKMAAATGGGEAGRNVAFPKIRTRQDMMFDDTLNTASNLPVAPNAKVHLGDLNWGDREKVLRLLFAKINAVQGSVRPMPAHPLAEAQQEARDEQQQMAMRSQMRQQQQQQSQQPQGVGMMEGQ